MPVTAFGKKDDVEKSYDVDILYDIHAEDGDRKEEGIQAQYHSEFSRVRITTKVEVDGDIDVEAKLSMDFDSGEKHPEVKDAYLSAELTKDISFTLGRQKVFGGMDQSLSKTAQYFLDRSLVNNLFGLSRYDVAQIEAERDEFDLYANLFQGYDSDENPITGWAAKAVFFIRGESSKNWEGTIGVNMNAVDAKEDNVSYGLSNNIFAAGTDGYKLKRPNAELLDYSTVSYDAGYRIGRFLMQGEFFQRDEHTPVEETYRSRGFYWLVNSSFFGVRRKLSGDAFEPDISKKGGFEVSFRYSAVKLYGDQFYGDANVMSAGINFYLSKHSKIAVQYEYGDVLEREDDEIKDQDATGVLSFRLQYTN